MFAIILLQIVAERKKIMRTVLNFNRKWNFRKKCDVTEKEENINLPHTWNGIDGQDGGNDYYRGIGIYTKKFGFDELPAGDKYYLEFLGVNSCAKVTLNGQNVGEHCGGYSTWRVNITAALKKENLLTIEVDNGICDTVYPQTADFTFYGGIYRDVNIVALEDAHFDLEYYGGSGIAVSPKLSENAANVKIEAYPVGITGGEMLIFKIFDSQGLLVAIKEQPATNTEAELVINNVHLWDGIKDPYLYSAEVTLISDGRNRDTVRTKFGCRSYRVDSERGFILNGREYALHGVSRHQDYKDIGNALTDEHHRKDIELIRELGATTIRLAHYQHADYFYELCDEAGLVVWAEIPYISRHNSAATENAKSQLTELIVQNYNHPSIFFWGLSNEITMGGADDPQLIETHKVLNELAHTLDDTRLTAIACLTTCPTDAEYIKIPDVVAYNHYFGWYGGEVKMNGPWFDKFHSEHPQIPIGVSEYGCEALNWHTSSPTQGDYTEEYQSYYHEEMIKQLFTRKYIFATYVWNMFDFGADARAEGGENGQNHKGLVTFDRKYKKDAFYAYKAWLSAEPFVHICSKRYVDRTEPQTIVKVYSNQREVELFVNGKSVGKEARYDHFFYFNITNEGESHITAISGECKDESVIRKVEKPNEDYILKEQGAVLNWFDVSAPEGFLSLNDKIETILKSKEGKALFESISAKMKAKMKDGSFPAPSREMYSMLGSFSLLRFTSLVSMMDVKFDKEELLSINERLNRIPKMQ